MTDIEFDREHLGRVHMEAWTAAAKSMPGLEGIAFKSWDQHSDDNREADMRAAEAVAAAVLTDPRLVVLEVPDGSAGEDHFTQHPFSVMLSDDDKSPARVRIITSPGDCRIVPRHARALAAALAVWADRAEALEPDREHVEAIAEVLSCHDGRGCGANRTDDARAILAALPGLGWKREGQ